MLERLGSGFRGALGLPHPAALMLPKCLSIDISTTSETEVREPKTDNAPT